MSVHDFVMGIFSYVKAKKVSVSNFKLFADVFLGQTLGRERRVIYMGWVFLKDTISCGSNSGDNWGPGEESCRSTTD